MWDCRLRHAAIRRAAALWSRCRGDKVDAGSPIITELQQSMCDITSVEDHWRMAEIAGVDILGADNGGVSRR